MLKLTAISLATASAFLAGCAVGPNYEAPRQTSPMTFRQADAVGYSAASPEANWWANFHDPVLNQLVADALTRNHDLRIGRAVLAEARALRRNALWAFAPQGGASALFARGQPSETESLPFASALAETWSAGFDAAWELDVFGGTRRRVEAANAELGIAGASLRDTQVALLAEVAANYFALRNTDEAIALVTRQLSALRDSHGITQRRLDAGRGTPLDTSRAEALLHETEAILPDLHRAAHEHRHRLAVLVGITPGELTLAAAPSVSAEMGPVRIGSPAELLRRRPDIQRAERALAATTAQIGVSTAALFPEVSIQGFFRFVGLSRDALGDAGTKSWGVAPTVRWRLFDYGRLHAQLRASRARSDGAMATYERTVLRALEETENALARYAAAQARIESLAARRGAAERARTLANQQYEAGSADPLARLDAERTALAAERDLIAADNERRLALIAIYKALGGGWNVSPPSSPVLAWRDR